MIEITDKSKCCGCSACAASCPKGCISMQEDNEGFLYPVVDKAICINCGACDRACPILNAEREKPFEQEAYIVQHKDLQVLRESTAGGAFTAIATYTLNNGGVVFGVAYDNDFRVYHTEATNALELARFRNSKYVQSDVGDTYKQAKDYLDNGRMVCYSGTPCQIEGLRNYLRKDYDNLILVDVVCRAVPSPGIWKKYISMVNEKNCRVKSVRFRDKTLGYQYSTMELKLADGKTYRDGIEAQPWLRMFFSGMIIRPSCSDCKFRSRYRRSDFTIWDCFNSYSIDKSFDENVGTTRVLLHTNKAKKIFDEIIKDYKYKKIPADTAVSGVAEMVKSPALHSRRSEFFRDTQEMQMENLLNKYFPKTVKVRLKRRTRLVLNRLGIDKKIKHMLKKG